LPRALLMAAFGLLLGTVGSDPINMTPRLTFGVMALGDGVNLVPLAIGLFGLSEVLFMARRTEEELKIVRPPSGLTGFLLGVMALELLRPRAQGVGPMSVTLFGVLYVAWLGAHLLYLRQMPLELGRPYAEGAAMVFLAVAPTWACDTVAYGVGMAFGRRRLLPAVSPKKSVEGSLGGLAAAIAATVGARAWFAPFLSLGDALVLGAAIGVFGQVGDLAESLLKRTSRAKDSGGLIPGHGGVLDRFDSLFFTAPLVFYYLKLVVFGRP
jgi:phosphatidate cytidylyltransferase